MNKLLYLNQCTHQGLLEWHGQIEDGRALVMRWSEGTLWGGIGESLRDARVNLSEVTSYLGNPSLEQVKEDAEWLIKYEGIEPEDEVDS